MKRLILIAALALALAAVPVLAGCGPSAGSGVPDPQGLAQETTETSVYYSTGRSLFEERIVVDANEPYRAALDVLLAAEPKSDQKVAIVVPQAKMRAVTFKDGIVTIDWTSDVLKFDAERNEKVLALAAVLRTLGEFPEVQKVRFTVDGKTDGKVDGKDVEAFWGVVSLKGQPWPVIRRDDGKTSKESSETFHP